MSTTQPIRSKQFLHDFKDYYLTKQPNFRNYTLILIGLNTALRIMIDAPKEVNIVRSTVLENQITDPEERAKLPKYYAEEEHPEKYRKKSNVIITKGNADK